VTDVMTHVMFMFSSTDFSKYKRSVTTISEQAKILVILF